MKVIHLSVECFPVAKVGGLADVVGALPKYQRTLGVDASVVMPYYDRPFFKNKQLNLVHEGTIKHGSTHLDYKILGEREESLGFPLYFVRIDGLLDRPEVYCYQDEAEQWIAFQHAFLDYVKSLGISPDVIHCHDHHVGLVPFLIQNSIEYHELSNIKTVFTIHNGQYQGWMNWNKGILLPPFNTWKWGLLDWDGQINPLAAAIKCCDRYTTVSQGYLEELYNEGNHLSSLFLAEKEKAVGIINGIDVEFWNPETDELISKNYSARTIKGGKNANRKKLAKEFNFDEKAVLISYIGRFAAEKGADLLSQIIDNLLIQKQYNLTIFILGSGDDQIKADIQHCLQNHESGLSVYFGYNEELAHQVYASSDFIIMPSRVEPCGLNQMYAMKYATIPIVHGVGGLKDTVKDVLSDDGYGYVFETLEISDIVGTINRALNDIEESKSLQRMRTKIMDLNFSWENSASKYLQLYNQLVEGE